MKSIAIFSKSTVCHYIVLIIMPCLMLIVLPKNATAAGSHQLSESYSDSLFKVSSYPGMHETSGEFGSYQDSLRWVPEKFILSQAVSADTEKLPPMVDTGSIKKIPEWWLAFDSVTAEIARETGLRADPVSDNKKSESCLIDAERRRLIQQHGEALLNGLRLNPGSAVAKQAFSQAVRYIAEFSDYLYCLDIDGIRYWDSVIAAWWKKTKQEAPGSITSCQAILATWNPALLVTDMIQHTGESAIVAAFDGEPDFYKKCLSLYPIGSYGAAWLDDFGTGRLARVSGAAAHENLIRVLAEPRYLGLGLCGLVEHAAGFNNPYGCIDGLDISLCLADESLPGLLLEAGAAWFEVKSFEGAGGTKVRAITINYPKSFFGTGTEALLSSTAPLTSGLCGDRSLGSGARKYADSTCVFAHVFANLGNTPQNKVMTCARRYLKGTRPYLEPPLKVDWQKFLDCGATTPESGNIDRTDQQKLRNINRQAKRDRKKSGTNDDIRGAAKTANDTTVTKDNQSYENALAIAREAGQIGEDERPPGLTLTVDDNTTIHLQPGLPPKAGLALEYHERFHVALDELGIHNSSYHETQMRRQGVPGTHRPIEPGTGGCRETAAAQRARRFFNCAYGETDVTDTAGLAPWIQPIGPQAAFSECTEVSDEAFWGSATGPSVTDPEGPEDLNKKGPIIPKGFDPKTDGVIDPPK